MIFRIELALFIRKTFAVSLWLPESIAVNFEMLVYSLLLLFLGFKEVSTLAHDVHQNEHRQHRHAFNKTVLADLEHLGELYYEDQKDERVYKIADDFNRMKPNFPCVHGVTPLGNAGAESIRDGHKFACGLHAIDRAPIVYSFGSNQQQDFEEAVLRLRPDAKVYVFELVPSHLPAVELRDSRISYHAIGLGGYEGVAPPAGQEKYVYQTMRKIMTDNQHAYVDLVKMDIEGVEFTWLRKEAPALIPRIGQFLVELHLHFGWVQQTYPKDDAFTFVTGVEQHGFRLFHQEINKHQTLRFTEMSFIHKNWTKWDMHKHEFQPLSL